ncbi:hypothetical protein [Aliarcobacter cryaerophilus]|jgi:hypothetical protein|uniref:hypothetical protein n=1 Tax=Aliarcobacter cryaerophilus TaxID=28198 RepID=UPI0021B24E1A|nr:hypothetical protein [Aliarcobacter cryaerophilus]MCT7483085.1 hypothetical protein [Aliarcobacter cryaerophilus]MCT7527500.1 hypothetical protein [Aliarcobacter cryaerophilus]MCT7540474.1 hypothetical protein [Aliarcobacter cryaerophilus]
MNDKNLELISDKDGFLFEINDESTLIFKITEIIVGISIIVFMFLLGASLQDTGVYSFKNAIVLIIIMFVYLIIFLVFSYKKRKILFYKDRLVLRIGNINKINIRIIDIEEVYKILPYHLLSNNNSKFNEKIKRWNIIRKILFTISFPILIFISILSYLVDIIFYRNFDLKRYRLIIIGKTDSSFLIVTYNKNNEENIKKYFKNNININLEELKPNYWFFIPQKNKKG